MKKPSMITSVESKVTFQEKMLVDFVNRNLSGNKSLANNSFSADFSIISWASTNIPVNGSLDILFATKNQENIERLSLPVCSLFFITCTKEKTGNCRVAWSCSLS
jgi:hypothetical protein